MGLVAGGLCRHRRFGPAHCRAVGRRPVPSHDGGHGRLEPSCDGLDAGPDTTGLGVSRASPRSLLRPCRCAGSCRSGQTDRPCRLVHPGRVHPLERSLRGSSPGDNPHGAGQRPAGTRCPRGRVAASGRRGRGHRHVAECACGCTAGRSAFSPGGRGRSWRCPPGGDPDGHCSDGPCRGKPRSGRRAGRRSTANEGVSDRSGSRVHQPDRGLTAGDETGRPGSVARERRKPSTASNDGNPPS